MTKSDTSLNLKRYFKTEFSWPGGESQVNLKELEGIKENSFEILGRKAYFELKPLQPINTTHLEIELALSGNLIEKYLSLFFVNIYIKEKDKDDYYFLTSNIALRNMQNIKYAFNGKEKKVEKIKIEISENKGLTW